MLAMVFATAMNLGSGQGPALGAFQLVPSFLVSADAADSTAGQEPPEEAPSGFRGDSVDKKRHAETQPEATEARKSTGWIAAAIPGTVVLGAFPGTLMTLDAGAQSSQSLAGPITVLVVGAALAGTGGYFLGKAADDGSLAAKIAIVCIDVIAAAAVTSTSVILVLTSHSCCIG